MRVACCVTLPLGMVFTVLWGSAVVTASCDTNPCFSGACTNIDTYPFFLCNCLPDIPNTARCKFSLSYTLSALSLHNVKTVSRVVICIITALTFFAHFTQPFRVSPIEQPMMTAPHHFQWVEHRAARSACPPLTSSKTPPA